MLLIKYIFIYVIHKTYFSVIRDASWELVPNAFEELLYRHNQCDAISCQCPKGRKHISSNA